MTMLEYCFYLVSSDEMTLELVFNNCRFGMYFLLGNRFELSRNLRKTTKFVFTSSVGVYHRTNVLCCKERSPQKKKFSDSKVREENIAVVYYSAMIAATRKVHFSCVLLLPSSWLGRVWVRADCLTHAWQIRRSRLGLDGLGPRNL